MSDAKKVRELFAAVTEGVVSKQEAELRKDSIDEATQEGVDTFYNEFKPARKSKGLGRKAHAPEENQVVGLEFGGVTFGADKWDLDYQNTRTITLGFRKKSDVIDIDLSGSNADHLVHFSKLLIWGGLKECPGKSVGSASTLAFHLRSTWTLVAYLQQNNFILNIKGAPIKPLGLMTAKELKKELKERAENKLPSVYVTGFFRTVSRWLYLADRVDLPEKFKPRISLKDWVSDKKFVKSMLRYEAERITPWRDIPHDQLMVLLGETQAYINDFSDDILYMQSMSHKLEAVLGPSSKTNKGKAFIKDNYLTGDMYDEIVAYNWAIDPRTGKPWFNPAFNKKSGDTKILHGEWFNQLSRLVECCNFQLTLWTAARVSELTQIKANGLFINGTRYNPASGNAVLAFKEALGPDGKRERKFELEFRVFKTSKDKKGKLVKIPLCDDPARAFCLLVEVHRVKREKLESPFLVPKGALSFAEIKKKDAKKPVNHAYFRTTLSRLCKRLGIDNQHPHRCRKTLATMIIKKNPDSLDLIQRLLNHHTPTMTLRYLMSIPGISSSVKQSIIESNRKRLINVLVATGTRRVGGGMSEGMVKGIDPEHLKATLIEDTIRDYVEVLLDDGNFIIHAVPAAFCLRFFKHVDERLPCLPDPDLVDVPLRMFAPDHAKCRPYECGYSLHTRKHRRRARENAKASRRLANTKGLRAELAKSFGFQAAYWEGVVEHLENGWEDYDDVLPAEAFEMGD